MMPVHTELVLSPCGAWPLQRVQVKHARPLLSSRGIGQMFTSIASPLLSIPTSAGHPTADAGGAVRVKLL
jgi:hypothetical protein